MGLSQQAVATVEAVEQNTASKKDAYNKQVREGLLDHLNKERLGGHYNSPVGVVEAEPVFLNMVEWEFSTEVGRGYNKRIERKSVTIHRFRLDDVVIGMYRTTQGGNRMTVERTCQSCGKPTYVEFHSYSHQGGFLGGIGKALRAEAVCPSCKIGVPTLCPTCGRSNL